MDRSGFEMSGTNERDEYWHVPGELLVAADDSEAAAEALAPMGYAPTDRKPSGAVVFSVTRDGAMPAPEVVAESRRRSETSALRISPHYLFGTYQRVPKTADHARATAEELPALPVEPGDFTVGIVDTGIVFHDDQHDGVAHPWFGSRFSLADGQEDPLAIDEHRLLATAVGHGTFVSGMVLKEAPSARIRMIGALQGGYTNEEAVVDAITQLACEGITLINLSFGGDTNQGGDDIPVALEAVLSSLDDEVVVVAAAGNHGNSRKVWPAAFERVIAVGALDDEPLWTRHRAPFSGTGPWVDVYAPGAFVLGPFCWHRERADAAKGCELEFCWHGSTFRDAQSYNGWARWSGTSFAAATVTGVIARVAADNDLSAREAAKRVLDRAERVKVISNEPGIWFDRPYVQSGSYA